MELDPYFKRKTTYIRHWNKPHTSLAFQWFNNLVKYISDYMYIFLLIKKRKKTLAINVGSYD